jgi:uncharacterized protein YbjT (DUF2867 family)
MMRPKETRMKVIIFGATGMVGQGVLRECLLDETIEGVLAITRKPLGQTHAKLRELLHADFTDFSAIESELWGYDACFFCLGVSSVGMTEEAYHRITYDFAVAAGKALAQRNPGMTFIFVSGAGTDSTEGGRTMWARVKGKAENALMKLPFKAVYCFRPAFIRPLHGIVHQSRSVRWLYAVLGPLYPLLKALFPKYVTTTEIVGRAMIAVARQGAPTRILESPQINAAIA